MFIIHSGLVYRFCPRLLQALLTRHGQVLSVASAALLTRHGQVLPVTNASFIDMARTGVVCD